MFKNLTKMLFALAMLISTFGFAESINSHTDFNSQQNLCKKYISFDSIIFENGQMLIVDGNGLLYVKTLHQDANGIFIYVAGPYGNCPNGHPYGPDGGCYGKNCPYN